MRGGRKNRQKAQGFSTLVFTLVILLSITMLVTVSSQAVVTHQKALTSYHQGQSAFDAAQAGLEYAVPYLDANYATLADGAHFTQTLTNGTSFSTSIQFLDGKNLLRVTSIGYSSDGIDSKTISKIVQYAEPEITTHWPYAVQARGNLMIRDNGKLMDTGGSPYTAKVGTTATITDSGKTEIFSGVSSTAGSVGADIVQNDTVLATKTNDQLQDQFLGTRISDLQAVTTEVSMPTNAGAVTGYIYDYSPSTFAPYSSAESITLNQVNGEAQIKGTTAIGSAAHPKNLVVNLSGNYTLPSGTVKPSEFQMRQNAEIYGDLVVNGNMTIVDATKVHGTIVVEGNLTLVDNAKIDGSVIVKGDVLLLNDSKVNGAVFALGKIQVHQNAVITGAVASGGEVRLTDHGKIDYNTGLASVTVAGSTHTAGYGQLAGSWADF